MRICYTECMVEQLFGSKTRVKLLQLFYTNSNRSFYVREITRKIDEQINSVRRELSNLLAIGIISSETQNNKLYYTVNKKFQYYQPLSDIFSETPNVGEAEEDVIDEDLRAVGRVDIALQTGIFTRDSVVGADFFIVGDINKTQLDKYIAKLEKSEGKEIRYVVLSAKEFEYRNRINDRFLNNIAKAKKQIIVDRNSHYTEK